MTQFQEFVTTQYAQGKTIHALAALTGRSHGTVRSALVAAGVELWPRARRPDKDLRSARTARSRQEEFSALLLSCRINAGLTGRQAGQRAGMSQSKLSKLENGRLAPKVNEVELLAEMYRVSPAVKARIIQLAAALATDGRPRPAMLRRGESSQHVRIALAE